MFDLMQYALIFYDFQLILAQMGAMAAPSGLQRSSTTPRTLLAHNDDSWANALCVWWQVAQTISSRLLRA
jgi:hypothetical protein